jgi:hypothetical protein
MRKHSLPRRLLTSLRPSRVEAEGLPTHLENPAADTQFAHDAGSFELVYTYTKPSAGSLVVSFSEEDATHRYRLVLLSGGLLRLFQDGGSLWTSTDTMPVSGVLKVRREEETISVYCDDVLVSDDDGFNPYIEATDYLTATVGTVVSLGTGGSISALDTYSI